MLTFRLARYDAHVGQTAIVTARLHGDEAIGFVIDGDWVEVTGRFKRGFIDATRAVNHTSGAEFRYSGGFSTLLKISLVLFLLIFVVVFAAAVYETMG